MFILRNAWRSILRNKVRNILIAVIVAVIAAAATIALSIRDAAQTARDEGLASTTVTATIGVDRDSLIQNMATEDMADGTMSETPDFDELRDAIAVDSLTLEQYDHYADITSVPVSTYYTEQASLNGSDELQPVETSSSEQSESSDDSDTDSADDANGMPGFPGGMGGTGGDFSFQSGDFLLTGFSSDTAVANASNGSFTMQDGQVFGYDEADAGDAIITTALASFNGLEVGDEITLTDPDDESDTYTLTIVGIYDNTATQNNGMGSMMGGAGMDPDNAIYTSAATLEALGLAPSDGSDATGSQLSYTYVLSSAEDYETFADEVQREGLDDGYVVSSTDVEQYESSLVPLENLSSFALTMLLIILAVGAAVLIVINLFNIRERRYEVGVLLAIGIRKAKVAAQFVFELLIVTMIGIALGVAAGAAASVPVTNQLLADQVSQQQSQSESVQSQFGRDADIPGLPDMGDLNMEDFAGVEAPPTGGFGGGFQQAVDYIDEINATVNPTVIGQLVLIGLALTLLSSLAGITSIVRYEPLRILADRS